MYILYIRNINSYRVIICLSDKKKYVITNSMYYLGIAGYFFFFKL